MIMCKLLSGIYYLVIILILKKNLNQPLDQTTHAVHFVFIGFHSGDQSAYIF